MLSSRRATPLAIALIVLGCAPMDGATEGLPNEITICGHGPTVEGIDVSSWQSTINWSAVASSGIRFAIVRIGDGYGHDAQFAANWQGARANGLIRGAYQFFEPGDDPIRQADIVVAAVGRLGPGDLPVTCDVEAPSPGVSPATYAARIHQWADRVTAGTGRAPMIYTGRYYWDPYVASSDFVGLPLWHAQYTSAACPNIDDRWSDWAFWQYTSTGSVPGIGGNVDRNRFNGTLAQLQALASAATCDAHCEGSVIVDATCGRGDCAAFGSRCVDDAIGTRCAFYACADRGDSTVCIDDHTIGNCHDGAVSTGDCAAYGARCTAEGGPARCAFYACPNVGNTTVCLDDHTLGTCNNGAVTTGDCAAYGAYCSSTGASGGTVAGHCASVFCVASATATPSEHDTCLPNGQLVHCTDTGGIENARDCAAGSTCMAVGGTSRCVNPNMPDPTPGDAGMGGGAMGGGTHEDAGTSTMTPAGDAGVSAMGDGSVSPMGDASTRTGAPIQGGCSVGFGHTRASLAAMLIALVALAARRRR